MKKRSKVLHRYEVPVRKGLTVRLSAYNKKAARKISQAYVLGLVDKKEELQRGITVIKNQHTYDITRLPF